MTTVSAVPPNSILLPIPGRTLPSAPTVKVPPILTRPEPAAFSTESSVTLVKSTVGSTVPLCCNVIVSPDSTALDRLASCGEPLGICTVSPLVGTAPPDQLLALFQSPLSAPVQVTVPGPLPLIVTGTLPVVSTPAWFHTSKLMVSEPLLEAV